MDSSEVRIIMALDHSLAFKVGIRHLWNRAPKTPKMPLTLVKMAVKIENFVKYFVVIKLLTFFILYAKHPNWLWTLIADLVFEILISFKFYLVYYCHKGIVKSFGVILIPLRRPVKSKNTYFDHEKTFQIFSTIKIDIFVLSKSLNHY